LERSDTATGATGEGIKVVGGKVFLLREGVWTDTAFDVERMRPVKVGFMSEDYFRLAAARPEWGAYLSVGERVLVVLSVADGHTAYLVVGQDEGEPIQALVPQPTPLPDTPAAMPSASETPTIQAQPSATRTQRAVSSPLTRGRVVLFLGAATAILLASIAVLFFHWPR
jgi:hypothetical protein